MDDLMFLLFLLAYLSVALLLIVLLLALVSVLVYLTPYLIRALRMKLLSNKYGLELNLSLLQLIRREKGDGSAHLQLHGFVGGVEVMIFDYVSDVSAEITDPVDSKIDILLSLLYMVADFLMMFYSKAHSGFIANYETGSCHRTVLVVNGEREEFVGVKKITHIDKWLGDIASGGAKA